MNVSDERHPIWFVPDRVKTAQRLTINFDISCDQVKEVPSVPSLVKNNI